MSQEFPVRVECLDNTTQSFSIQATNSMLMRDLRRLIATEVQMKPADIRLSCLGKTIDDLNTVEYYHLQTNILFIAFVQKAKRVTISTTSGASSEEKLFPGDTVTAFLQRFKRNNGISGNNIIMFRGIELDSSQVLSELGIEEDDMLSLKIAVPGGEICSN